MKKTTLSLENQFKLLLAKLLARVWFFHKHFLAPLLPKSTPKATTKTSSKPAKKPTPKSTAKPTPKSTQKPAPKPTPSPYFRPKHPHSAKKLAFFTYATSFSWREWHRSQAIFWHSLFHQKSPIKKANPKKIARYAKQNQRLILRRHSSTGTIIRLIISFIITISLLYGVYWVYHTIFATLPPITNLTAEQPPMTTQILDRNNHLLFSIYEDENRTPIALHEVAPQLIQATLAIEDSKFYEHNGYDLQAIFRAFIANQQSGEITQGASTITQQLVKLRLLSREQTFTRKIKEIILSILVEGNFSKNQILEMYLNEVNYGGAVYGIEQAAVTFFGKNASDLTLSESAFLAGLPQAPSRYSPFAGNLEASYARRDEVLRRMREDGYITREQEVAAASEALVFQESTLTIQAPHFVMYVRELLADLYGEEIVSTGGLVVRTSLDLNLQNQVQEIVSSEVASLESLNIHNGAALVTNPQTGEILAMVGRIDYFDFANDGMVNVTTRQRQPGSSIKPLTYATALEDFGYHPASLILDAPVTYSFAGGPDYSPKNYDGSYRGLVTLRESLGSSYNIPAVKLLEQIGLDNEIDQAESMGISTWTDRSRLGLSLTLGGGEVTMLDLTQMYGTFANQGVTIPENPILEVYNYQGQPIYQNNCALTGDGCIGERALSSGTSYQISHILSDNNARTPAFGAQSVLNIPGQQVAVKTGTTNNLRDNWTIGYTTDRVIATWVGNNDNQPMSYVASGITGASPIWQEIMLTQLNPDQPHIFPVPSDIVLQDYCGQVEGFRVGQVPTTAACKPARSPDIPSDPLP